MLRRFYLLLNGVVIDDADVFNEKLQEWEHFYNYARPHGALGGQTPYQRTSTEDDVCSAPELSFLPHTV